MTTTQETETVFIYRVSFVADNGSVNIEIVEDTGDIPHEAMAVHAEFLLTQMWGTKSIPAIYNIINVEVYEDTV